MFRSESKYPDGMLPDAAAEAGWGRRGRTGRSPRQIELRPREIDLIPEVDVTDFEIVLRLLEVGSLAQRARHCRLEVDRLCGRRRSIDRVQRRRPERIVRAAHDQPLEGELRRPDVGLRLDERLPAVGGFRLRRHDVDRRERADLDAGLVVLHEFAGEIQRVLRRFDRLNGVDQIPVRVPRVRLRADARRLERDLVVLLADAVGLERRARRIDLEAPQQRLDDGAGQPGLVLGVAEVDRGLAVQSIVRPGNRVVTAAVKQVLREARRPRLAGAGRRLIDPLRRHAREVDGPRVVSALTSGSAGSSRRGWRS